MLQKNVVSVHELTSCLDRNRGMHGLGKARELLAITADGSESFAERLFVRLLRREKITGWRRQVSLCGFRLDFGWPAERIGVEIHGHAFHRHQDRFDRDLVKANAIAGIGWLPLAYSCRRLNRDPESCIRELTDALASRRADLC
ncbi:endonuclease domain-containing protein [Gordonia neofelifaecis]|uniref:endonuclease domain-containing protein n=1 Tax=Gordonia neofelifaecis TaxID=945692 RepID=UPI00068311CB|nr:DUF559 domain-containing protein [Gordonia neofelifaecis]